MYQHFQKKPTTKLASLKFYKTKYINLLFIFIYSLKLLYLFEKIHTWFKYILSQTSLFRNNDFYLSLIYCN